MSERELRTHAGSILYDESRTSQPDMAWFTREFWAQRRALAEVRGGRGQVLYVHDGERRWVVRHYRRGGFVARLVTDAFVWLGPGWTRSFREWRLLDTLRREGFPVPVPVAARYVRHGLVYRADLITEELADTHTLAQAVTTAPVPERIWERIGAEVARLQARGVHHADLNAHNILLGAEGTVYLIDFDRGRIRPRGSWEEAVLARLRRSLDKVKRQQPQVYFGEAEWAAFRRGYEGRGQGIGVGDRGQGTGDRGQGTGDSG